MTTGQFVAAPFAVAGAVLIIIGLWIQRQALASADNPAASWWTPVWKMPWHLREPATLERYLLGETLRDTGLLMAVAGVLWGRLG